LCINIADKYRWDLGIRDEQPLPDNLPADKITGLFVRIRGEYLFNKIYLTTATKNNLYNEIIKEFIETQDRYMNKQIYQIYVLPKNGRKLITTDDDVRALSVWQEIEAILVDAHRS